MDTYRTNTTPEAMRQQGEMGLRHIEAFQPQVVIVLDDPAARYVMLPLIRHPNIAIVFSGMNA